MCNTEWVGCGDYIRYYVPLLIPPYGSIWKTTSGIHIAGLVEKGLIVPITLYHVLCAIGSRLLSMTVPLERSARRSLSPASCLCLCTIPPLIRRVPIEYHAHPLSVVNRAQSWRVSQYLVGRYREIPYGYLIGWISAIRCVSSDASARHNIMTAKIEANSS